MARRNSTFGAALAYCQDRIAEAASAGQVRIAGVRELSRGGGFAINTCRKALRMLASRGACTVVPGGGVMVVPGARSAAPASPLPAGPPPVRRRWEEMRERLSRDMFAGRHGPGALLPTAKLLAAGCGSSPAVLSAALRALLDEGRLERRGRRFRVAEPRRRAGSTVVLVAQTRTPAELVLGSRKNEEFLHHLERRCFQWDLHLRYLSAADVADWTPAARGLFGGGHSEPVIGVLVWTLGLNTESVETVAGNLRTGGVRAAFLDENGHFRQPDIVRTCALFQLHEMSFSPLAGRDMGAHLLGRGHRTVAFISDAAEEPFGHNRALGLEQYLAKHGGGTVRPLWISGFVDQWGFGAGGVPDKGPYRRMRAQAERILAHFSDTQGIPHCSGFGRAASELIYLRALKDRLDPMLDSVRAMRDVTAWVAGADRVGILLLEYLRARGVDVPGRLSVVSFDDMPWSLNAGLTSYNFNVTAVADAMLEHVLGGPRRPGRRKGEAVEVPGFVTERGSSGPARPA